MFRSPLFAWSPRPDQEPNPFAGSPASQSSSRFGAFQNNIRTMINGSSIYSQSPALSNANTPKLPFLGFFRRDQSPDPNVLPYHNDAPRYSNDSRSPLRAQHSASSYIGSIVPLHDSREPETIYSRHPADVPLPTRQDSAYIDPEIQQLSEEVNGNRKKRRHRRRKHRHAASTRWVRRRDDRGAHGPMLFVRGTQTRGKMIALMISGTFLLTVLAIYLAIALTNKSLGQEIHIMFIMMLLAITIFFCHSLIRLCMLILNPPRTHSRPRAPDMTSADGFQPIVPIRVHLARDDEAAVESEVEPQRDHDLEKDLIPPPPPAYGLWRSSVRVDPNLLHWQRVEAQNNAESSAASSMAGSAIAQEPVLEGPRPPSYVSEDGVSYIVEAAPRSTVRESHSGVSDIHPAWRPGYAMSEIRGGEVPVGVRRL